MFSHHDMTHAKAELERLRTKVKHSAAKNEAQIDTALRAVGTVGSLFAWGYINERFGESPKDHPEAPKEHKILGAPSDLAVGFTVGAFAAFGGLGKYAAAGLNIAESSVGSFAARFGQELGKKALEKHQQSAAPKTAGAARVTGRAHHVAYE
jgi:hypothetical protein